MPFGLELLAWIVVVSLPRFSSCPCSSLVLVTGFLEPKSICFFVCVHFLAINGKFDRSFLHGWRQQVGFGLEQNLAHGMHLT